MVCFLLTAKEMPWAKEKSWEKESQEDMGSSTFPYPPGFERRFSLLIPFKHKVHQLEGGGNGSKVRVHREKQAVHEIRLLWAKGQVAESVKMQEAAQGLNYGFSIVQHNMGSPFSIQSTIQHHPRPVQKNSWRVGFHLWYHLLSYSWFAIAAKKLKSWYLHFVCEYKCWDPDCCNHWGQLKWK